MLKRLTLFLSIIVIFQSCGQLVKKKDKTQEIIWPEFSFKTDEVRFNYREIFIDYSFVIRKNAPLKKRIYYQVHNELYAIAEDDSLVFVDEIITNPLRYQLTNDSFIYDSYQRTGSWRYIDTSKLPTNIEDYLLKTTIKTSYSNSFPDSIITAQFDFEEKLKIDKIALAKKWKDLEDFGSEEGIAFFEEMKKDNIRFKTYDLNVFQDEKGINISHTLFINMEGKGMPYQDRKSYNLVYKLYKDGVLRSRKKSVHFPFWNDYRSKKVQTKLAFYDIEAPPGEHDYEIRVYIEQNMGDISSFIDKRNIHFTQPQLHLFSFELLDVNVNVSGMDVGLWPFSKGRAGKGYGDLYIKFGPYYRTPVMQNSGYIKRHKAAFQFPENIEEMDIIFLDKDAFKDDHIYTFILDDLSSGNHQESFAAERVKKSTLIYTIGKVTQDNYKNLVQKK